MVELTYIEFIRKFNNDEIDFKIYMCDHFRVKEWNLDLRELNDHIFYFNTIGQWGGHIEFEDFESEAESVFWMSSGCKHQFKKQTRAKERGFINIRSRFYIDKEEVRISEKYLLIENASEMLSFFQMIYSEYRMKDEWSIIRIKSVFKLLFTSMLRRLEKNKNSGIIFSHKQKSDCLKYIDINLNKKVVIGELAANVGLSHDYFTRVFKNTFGVAPKIWIKESRLRKSQIYILESKLSINEIAIELGYENPYLFCRQFKEFFGITTTEYKKNPVITKMPKTKI